MLNGFNQHSVRNKDKLSLIIGAYTFFVGSLLVILSFVFLDTGTEETIGIVLRLIALGYLLLAVYVDTNMVDK